MHGANRQIASRLTGLDTDEDKTVVR